MKEDEKGELGGGTKGSIREKYRKKKLKDAERKKAAARAAKKYKDLINRAKQEKRERESKSKVNKQENKKESKKKGGGLVSRFLALGKEREAADLKAARQNNKKPKN